MGYTTYFHKINTPPECYFENTAELLPQCIVQCNAAIVENVVEKNDTNSTTSFTELGIKDQYVW